jgi:hypothetical protein
VKPRNTADVRLHMLQYEDEGMSEYGGDRDELAVVLEIGDNFVVPAEADNDVNVTYYICSARNRRFWFVSDLNALGGGVDRGRRIRCGRDILPEVESLL